MGSHAFKGTADVVVSIFPWKSCGFWGNIVMYPAMQPGMYRLVPWLALSSKAPPVQYPRYFPEVTWPCLNRFFSLYLKINKIRINIVLLQRLPSLRCSLWPRLWLHYTANTCSQCELSMTSCTVAMVQASHTMPTWDVSHEYTQQ